MDGILNIRKEVGYTSFDVVARLRGILHQKKTGHTGTLDPAATGVLPVCIGKATKLCSFLTDGKKTYEAVLLLGTTTDTLDIQGRVTENKPVLCGNDEIRNCVASFLGEQEQLPPMYSAVKVKGKRLYEIARQGGSVERKPRKAFFYEIEILSIEMPRVALRVSCSKGTYIRTLCNDIGEALGCGGCMESLVRTRSGRFLIEDAHTLSEIEEMAGRGEIEKVLITMDEVLSDYPAVTVPQSLDKAARNGGKLSAEACRFETDAPRDGTYIRLRSFEGELIGIFSYSSDGDILRPVKMLCVA